MHFKVGYVILGTVGQCSLFFDNFSALENVFFTQFFSLKTQHANW